MGSDSKQIRILHIYHDLMNLYGDWANVAVLERELALRGCEVIVDKKSVGDVIDFDFYDFLYIGSGTERSLIACMRDIERYKDVMIDRVNAGVVMLATGNSHELFGQAVTGSDGVRHEMLGLLDFETMQKNTRVTGDCVFTTSFADGKMIGFINRSGGSQLARGKTKENQSVKNHGERNSENYRENQSRENLSGGVSAENIDRPFSIEPREGANYAAGTEGIRYKNLIGTYMTGPLLVRNPPLLKYFTDLFTDAVRQDDDLFFDYQEKAFRVALSEL